MQRTPHLTVWRSDTGTTDKCICVAVSEWYAYAIAARASLTHDMCTIRNYRDGSNDQSDVVHAVFVNGHRVWHALETADAADYDAETYPDGDTGCKHQMCVELTSMNGTVLRQQWMNVAGRSGIALDTSSVQTPIAGIHIKLMD